MSTKTRIKNLYADLPPNQQRVAGFFLRAELDDLNLPIGEISQRIGTSVASISRFCRSIGYDSFGQFKLALSQDIKYRGDEVLPIFQESDDADTTIRRIFAEGITNLQETEKQVGFAEIKRAAELIRSAGSLRLIGLGGSGGVAKLGALLFSHLGIVAHAVSDPYEMLVLSGHANKDTLLIAISHSGETTSVVESLELAKTRGCPTIAITNYAESRLKAADATLLTNCYEGRVHFAQSNSMIPQIAILDSLYAILASEATADVVKAVGTIEEAVASRLRRKK
jgi:DNA-binding MurR/RpiR family transcriptional regulator